LLRSPGCLLSFQILDHLDEVFRLKWFVEKSLHPSERKWVSSTRSEELVRENNIGFCQVVQLVDFFTESEKVMFSKW